MATIAVRVPAPAGPKHAEHAIFHQWRMPRNERTCRTKSWLLSGTTNRWLTESRALKRQVRRILATRRATTAQKALRILQDPTQTIPFLGRFA